MSELLSGIFKNHEVGTLVDDRRQSDGEYRASLACCSLCGGYAFFMIALNDLKGGGALTLNRKPLFCRYVVNVKMGFENDEKDGA